MRPNRPSGGCDAGSRYRSACHELKLHYRRAHVWLPRRHSAPSHGPRPAAAALDVPLGL